MFNEKAHYKIVESWCSCLAKDHLKMIVGCWTKVVRYDWGNCTKERRGNRAVMVLHAEEHGSCLAYGARSIVRHSPPRVDAATPLPYPRQEGRKKGQGPGIGLGACVAWR